MSVFISMIIWVIFMRLLCFSGIKNACLLRENKNYKVRAHVSILTMGYIVFWLGLRSYMADTWVYVQVFKQSPSHIEELSSIIVSEDKGALWTASIILFKSFISGNWQLWLLCLASIMGFSVSYTLRKHSEGFFFSMLLFILACDFAWMYNGMRQFICVTTLMLALPWLIRGETIKYMLLIAILSFVHFTVLIMIPIYFLVRQKPWGKLVILSILIVCVACSFTSQFASIAENALSYTTYKNASIIAAYDDGANPIRALVLSVPAILSWIKRKQLNRENNRELNIYINLSLMAALLMWFAVFTSGIMMGRLAIYCSIYSTILLPMLISRIEQTDFKRAITFFCILCYTVYFYIETCNEVYISKIITL